MKQNETKKREKEKKRKIAKEVVIDKQ